MRYIFLTVLVILSVWFLGRDIMAIGEARRNQRPALVYLTKFRRHAKGMILLLGLYLSVAFFDNIVRAGVFTAREYILFVGLLVVMLIWLLMLATRDLREVALEGIADQQRLLQESMEDLQTEMIEARRNPKADKSTEGPKQA